MNDINLVAENKLNLEETKSNQACMVRQFSDCNQYFTAKHFMQMHALKYITKFISNYPKDSVSDLLGQDFQVFKFIPRNCLISLQSL